MDLQTVGVISKSTHFHHRAVTSDGRAASRDVRGRRHDNYHDKRRRPDNKRREKEASCASDHFFRQLSAIIQAVQHLPRYSIAHQRSTEQQLRSHWHSCRSKHGSKRDTRASARGTIDCVSQCKIKIKMRPGIQTNSPSANI